MLKKLSITELIAIMREQIEAKTGYSCVDNPVNEPSPFYFIEFINKVQSNTKTMWCETFHVLIHVISEPDTGNTQNYDMITALEEAMTEELQLPDGFTLISQMEAGVNARQTDETGENHTVILYEIKVCYGYKIK